MRHKHKVKVKVKGTFVLRTVRSRASKRELIELLVAYRHDKDKGAQEAFLRSFFDTVIKNDTFTIDTM